jgi:hypothetical protein
VPQFSAEFSTPSKFSGVVPEKELSTAWARTFDLLITNWTLHKSATASLMNVFVAGSTNYMDEI